jgi:hypothetical protein
MKKLNKNEEILLEFIAKKSVRTQKIVRVNLVDLGCVI